MDGEDDIFETLQIEVSNRCNLECIMCIRRSWETKEVDFNIDMYRKIAKNWFPQLKRLVLYGFGEPFINPNIIRMLNLGREYLRKDSDILINTNGTFLTPELSEKLLKRKLIDELVFSIDSLDTLKFRKIRKGAKEETIKNLRCVLRTREALGSELKIGVEVVLMYDNLEELPKIVEVLAEQDIDYILVSHVVPYLEEISEKAAYITISQNQIENLLSLEEKDVSTSFYDKIYHMVINIEAIADQKIAQFEKQKIWEKMLEKKCPINFPFLLKSLNKLRILKKVQENFKLSEKIASKYCIELKLPKILPEAKERVCPYVQKKVIFIRSDGKVAPCMEFSYPHSLYINGHLKEIREILFGDLQFQELNFIWDKEKYRVFRDVRKNMPEKIPWCGDCVFSTWCFFARTNERDCFTNEPGCSECLYSVGLSLCNI